MATRNTPERFWSRVEKTSGCWLWRGYINPEGYGAVGWNGTVKRAHQVAFALIRGSVPDGKELDHLCRVRHCVNPDHLEPVTHRENILRGRAPSAFHAVKTHCVNGHELTPENTHRVEHGWRVCRSCQRANTARYMARKKAAA